MCLWEWEIASLHYRPTCYLHNSTVDMRKSKSSRLAATKFAKDQCRDRIFTLDIRHLQGIHTAIGRDVRPGILRKQVEITRVAGILSGEACQTGAVGVHLP